MRILYLLFALLLTQPSFAQEQVKQGEFLGAKPLESLPDWFKTSFLDFSEDLIEATDENRHIMIYFHQNGCPYCAKLVNDNFHNESLVAKLKKHFEVIQINMWGDRDLTDWQGREFSEKQFSSVMQVQFTPTLLFLNAKGSTLLRLNGYQPTDKMHAVLDYISGKKYLKQSFASYANKLKKNKTGRLNTSPLFASAPYLLTRSKAAPAQDYLAVVFEELNCKNCEQFHQNLAQSESTKKLLQQMQVVQLNAHSAEKIITPAGKKTTASDWYEALKLTYKPAIVLFDKNGKEIIRKDAMFRKFHFESIIDYVLTGGYQQQPNFQRYIEEKADKLRAAGLDVNIWQQQQF